MAELAENLYLVVEEANFGFYFILSDFTFILLMLDLQGRFKRLK
jgi:hypothetical protein